MQDRPIRILAPLQTMTLMPGLTAGIAPRTTTQTAILPLPLVRSGFAYPSQDGGFELLGEF